MCKSSKTTIIAVEFYRPGVMSSNASLHLVQTNSYNAITFLRDNCFGACSLGLNFAHTFHCQLRSCDTSRSSLFMCWVHGQIQGFRCSKPIILKPRVNINVVSQCTWQTELHLLQHQAAFMEVFHLRNSVFNRNCFYLPKSQFGNKSRFILLYIPVC